MRDMIRIVTPIAGVETIKNGRQVPRMAACLQTKFYLQPKAKIGRRICGYWVRAKALVSKGSCRLTPGFQRYVYVHLFE